MRPIWFDVDQCALSEVKPLKQSGAFTVRAHSWKSTLTGEILGYAGHLHDGGDNVILDVDGKDVCTSQATYGGNKEYIATMAPMGNPNSATVHISKMSICQGSTLNTPMMKAGQSWTLRANYDYNKNKGMLGEDGHQEDIMGIAIMCKLHLNSRTLVRATLTFAIRRPSTLVRLEERPFDGRRLLSFFFERLLVMIRFGAVSYRHSLCINISNFESELLLQTLNHVAVSAGRVLSTIVLCIVEYVARLACCHLIYVG